MSSPVQILQSARLSYPGMMPREALVWQNWLKLHEAEYDRFDYNLRVGAGFDPGPEWPEYIRKQALDNSKKRIDAVAWKGEQATLCEVKDRAGASAVGQIVVYRPLFVRAFPDKPPPLLLLVTNRLANDVIHALLEQGIGYVLVEADYGVLRTRTPARAPLPPKS